MHAVEELSHRVGVAAACTALEIPRASFYRRPAWQAALGSSAAVATDEGLPGSSSTSPRALKREEHQAVLAHMHSERFVDRSPREVYAKLLDEGVYLCSVRTLYRILDAHQEVRERRDQRRHPHYRQPELLATAPNQVWSWDITNKLLAPVKWSYFHLYVILDIFSRSLRGLA